MFALGSIAAPTVVQCLLWALLQLNSGAVFALGSVAAIAVVPAPDSSPEETGARLAVRLSQVVASQLNRREAVPVASHSPSISSLGWGLLLVFLSLAVGLTHRPCLPPPALLVYNPVNGPLQASPAAVGEPVSHLELCLLQNVYGAWSQNETTSILLTGHKHCSHSWPGSGWSCAWQ